MMNTAYTPATIGGAFYNYLENWTEQQQPCTIEYRQNDGSSVQVSSRIIDLFTWQGSEYMLMEKGQLIRLDRLVRVNNTTPLS